MKQQIKKIVRDENLDYEGQYNLFVYVEDVIDTWQVVKELEKKYNIPSYKLELCAVIKQIGDYMLHYTTHTEPIEITEEEIQKTLHPQMGRATPEETKKLLFECAKNQ